MYMYLTVPCGWYNGGVPQLPVVASGCKSTPHFLSLQSRTRAKVEVKRPLSGAICMDARAVYICMHDIHAHGTSYT